jgi:elongation factor Ts
MAEITAQLVKELREMTGAGMMECKKALEEANGEIEAAVDVLRTRGLAAAAKRAGRATNEGLIVITVSEDGREAAIAEVNCETDFVSRNDVFAGYAGLVSDAVLAGDPADLDALADVSLGDQTVGEMITNAISTIGENIQITRFLRTTVDTGLIASYIHGGGRLGILVNLKLGNQASAGDDEIRALGKDIAMQVAASNPGAISREDFAPELIERELAIYRTQAEESGKSEDIQNRMVEGRLEKFYSESALVEQAFIKDTDKTVRQVIDAVIKSVGDTIEVVAFERFELGQG